MIQDVHPKSRILLFFRPGSPIQKSKKHRIPDTDLQTLDTLYVKKTFEVRNKSFATELNENVRTFQSGFPVC